jgi:hypothetical protein
MNIKEALLNPVQDKKWVGKVLLGGLLSSTIFTLPIANGYIVVYLRSLLKHDEGHLPRWSQIREILTASVRLIVIDFVYAFFPGIFMAIIRPWHDASSFKDKAIIWIPLCLVIIFFLNIAHVLFAVNDYKISAGLNIKKILLILRFKIKEYLPIYIFSSILFLLSITPVFIDFAHSIGSILKYSFNFIRSIFIFYSNLVISNLLSMVFRELNYLTQAKQTKRKDGEIRREKSGGVKSGRVKRLGRLGLGLN